MINYLIDKRVCLLILQHKRQTVKFIRNIKTNFVYFLAMPSIIILLQKSQKKAKSRKMILRTVESEQKYKMIKRGELYYADLSPVVGSEQGGIRPILVVQNDTGNKYSPTIIAAAITSQLNKAKLPTHIELPAKEVGLAKNSVILLEQIRTLDKKRLKERIGELPPLKMKKVDAALMISLGFETYFNNSQPV